jgi:DNA-binding MarR family transcriptional regulator
VATRTASRTGSRTVPRRNGVDADEVASQLRLAVTKLGRILRYQDPAGLSATQSSALATVARRGPLTLGDLAAREHVTPPTITRVVDKLEQAGLVRRETDTRDGRVVLVSLTPAGARWADETRSRKTAWLAVRLQDLPGADLRCLADAARILSHLMEAAGPSSVP